MRRGGARTSAANQDAPSGVESLTSDELKQLGNAKFREGDLHGAVELFTEAITVSVSEGGRSQINVAALNNRAQAYLSLKEYSKALEDCSHVLDVDAGNKKARYRRAICHVEVVESADAAAAAAAGGMDAGRKRRMLEAAERDLQEVGGEEEMLEHVRRLLRRETEEAQGEVGGKFAVVDVKEDDSVQVAEEDEDARHYTRIAISQGGGEEEDDNEDEDADEEDDAAAAAAADAAATPPAPPAAAAAKPKASSPSKTAATTTKRNKQRQQRDRAQSNALKDRGNSSMQRGEWQQAVDLYTEALAVDDTNTAARNNRAQAHIKLEQFASAVSDATAVLGAEAENVKALYRRAFSSVELAKVESDAAEVKAQYKQARQDLLKVLAKEPEHQLARTLLNTTNQSLADIIRAEKAAEAAAAQRAALRSTAAAQAQAARNSGASAPAASVSSPAASSASPGSRRPRQSPSAATPEVKDEAPKTLYEFEREWRSLKDYPELLAQYLRKFKNKTFSRIFREPPTPELTSSIVHALDAHMLPQYPKAAARILSGLANMPELTRMMLTEEDNAAIRSALDKLQQSDDRATEAAELRAQFGF